MPALYAHDTFGAKVAQRLPAEVKRPILQYPHLFRVGLQGPDILFYYNPFKACPVGDTGHRMHQETAISFFQKARMVWKTEGESPAQLSYLMGFFCHFMLDSACHPYVGRQVERAGIAHVALEREFDRLLLALDGKDPVSFPMGYCIPAEAGMGRQIAPYYPGVSAKEVQKSIKAMVRYKNWLVIPNQAVLSAADKVLEMIGQYNSVSQHIIRPEGDPRCRMSCEHLLELYRREIPQAARQLQGLYKAMIAGAPFDGRLDRTFE